jgi:hypothetical protein
MARSVTRWALAGGAEALPLAVVADREDEPIVGGLERLIGNNLQVGVALPGRHLAAGQIRLHEVDLGGHRAIEQGQVDRIAVPRLRPRVQAGQDRA